MTSALAWPVVVAVLLILGRHRLPSLIDRLQEFSLPGGANAKFERAVVTALEKADEFDFSEQKNSKDEADVLDLEDEIALLVKVSPRSAIVRAFYEVEASLVAVAEYLGLNPKKMSPRAILRWMRDKGHITEDVLELYSSIARVRNAAAHVRGEPVTSEMALEFWDRTSSFAKGLRQIARHVKQNPSREAGD